MSQDDGLIAEKMFNILLYLYMEEDLSVLSAFEVYLYNGDTEEFLDTLFMIEKIYFFRDSAVTDSIYRKQLLILIII